MTKPVRAPEEASWLGRRLPVTVGPVAHGGHCVARYEGRVIFVRHALPGEQVIVQVTEDRSESYCRADAIEITVASPDRVAPPCRYAHPGGCGGCDFQHVSPAAQRRMKSAVIEEQFERLAKLHVQIEVEQLAPAELGWRRRVRYAATADGRLGLRLHRSHEVLPIEQCLIAADPVARPPQPSDESGRDVAEVELAVDDDGRIATVAFREQKPRERAPARRTGRNRAAPRQTQRSELLSGPSQLTFRAGGRQFEVGAGGFWQTHPAAAETFLAAALGETAPRPGERVLDLYAGAGLFTAAFATAVTEAGQVLGLEGDRDAAADAARNLADLPWSGVTHAAVTATTVRAAAQQIGGVDVVDLVILDPPRTGAGRAVMQAILELEPRAVCYVACDPAALARDVATAQDAGWQLSAIRAFDAFPMTHHVECVAVLRP